MSVVLIDARQQRNHQSTHQRRARGDDAEDDRKKRDLARPRPIHQSDNRRHACCQGRPQGHLQLPPKVRRGPRRDSTAEAAEQSSEPPPPARPRPMLLLLILAATYMGRRSQSLLAGPGRGPHGRDGWCCSTADVGYVCIHDGPAAVVRRGLDFPRGGADPVRFDVWQYEMRSVYLDRDCRSSNQNEKYERRWIACAVGFTPKNKSSRWFAVVVVEVLVASSHTDLDLDLQTRQRGGSFACLLLLGSFWVSVGPTSCFFRPFFPRIALRQSLLFAHVCLCVCAGPCPLPALVS